MIKYFIERADGLWLSSLDEDGPSWTDDPFKAWVFEPTTSWAQYAQDREAKLWWDKPIPLRTTAEPVLKFLHEEFYIPGLRLTEQQFPLENMHTTKGLDESFKDTLITGVSMIKTTLRKW